jgi:putative MATE family efflux protein
LNPSADPEESAEIRREAWRQSWPLAAQSLLRSLMFLVDTLMIGVLGSEALAGMGVAGPVAYLVMSVLGALQVGAIATVARAWGSGDASRQRGEAAAAAVLGIAIGVPAAAAGWFGLPLLAELLPVEGAPGVTAQAEGYLRWEGAGLGFLCLGLASSAVWRAAGRTRVPLLCSVVGNAANILFNWIFIYGHAGAPALGLEGAGLATALAQGLEASLTFGLLFLERSPVRLRAAALLAVPGASLARLIRVSIPAALEPAVMQGGFLLFTRIITGLGEASLAAHRTALSVESLTFMAGYGISLAGSGMVGRYLGAGRPDLADRALGECARLALLSMSGVGILFLLGADVLTGVFLGAGDEAEAAALAASCLRIAAVEQPFMALAMVLGGGLRGAGDTRSPVVVGLLGIWIVRLPLAWALAVPAGLGLRGVWITMIVDWAVRAVVFHRKVRSGGWKRIRL